MTLKELLHSYKGQKVTVIPNPGNAGDGLIHAGWAAVTRLASVDYDVLHSPEHRTGEVVFIVGAGAFCANSAHGIETVNYYAKHFKAVYVLPASFEIDYPPVRAFAQNLAPNVIIYCRELVSFNGMKALAPLANNIRLDHDLALQLDVTKWKKQGTGVLRAFRTDKESAQASLPQLNFDISRMGDEKQETLILDIVSNYETIYTDRLHVAIAGTLLGKDVNVFEGSYHKIRAVYDHSLKGYSNLKLRSPQEMEGLLSREAFDGKVQVLREWAHRIPHGTRVLRGLKRAWMKQRI